MLEEIYVFTVLRLRPFTSSFHSVFLGFYLASPLRGGDIVLYFLSHVDLFFQIF